MPWIGRALPGPDDDEPRREAASWEQRWRREWVPPGSGVDPADTRQLDLLCSDRPCGEGGLEAGLA